MSTIQTIFIYLIFALIVLSEIYIKHHTKRIRLNIQLMTEHAM